MNRRSAKMVLTIILSLSVAFGCGGTKNRVRKLPEAPQYEAIKAACLEHKKSKDNGELKVPIEREARALRMLAKTWGNYEYAKKEQQKMAIKFNAQVRASKVDLQVSETRRYDAEAQAAKHRRHFWIAVAVGAAAAALAFGVGAIAF